MDDFPFYKQMKLPQVQLVFAILITTLCIYDYISGFIYAMLIMLIYYEIYRNKIISTHQDKVHKVGDKYNINMKNKLLENFIDKYDTAKNNNIILLDYISQKHLDDAQNGYIFNKENYEKYNITNFDYDIQGITNNENNIGGNDLISVTNNIT